jgi:hypothetical protein
MTTHLHRLAAQASRVRSAVHPIAGAIFEPATPEPARDEAPLETHAEEPTRGFPRAEAAERAMLRPTPAEEPSSVPTPLLLSRPEPREERLTDAPRAVASVPAPDAPTLTNLPLRPHDRAPQTPPVPARLSRPSQPATSAAANPASSPSLFPAADAPEPLFEPLRPSVSNRLAAQEVHDDPLAFAPTDAVAQPSNSIPASLPGRVAASPQAQRRESPRASDDIHIHIGRVEVIAVPQAAPRPASPRRAEGLDDFLRRQDRRSR